MWCLSDCFCSSGDGVLPSHPLLSYFVIPISLAPKVALVNISFDIYQGYLRKGSFFSLAHGFCTLFWCTCVFSRL
jgi:hypothetical protein